MVATPLTLERNKPNTCLRISGTSTVFNVGDFKTRLFLVSTFVKILSVKGFQFKNIQINDQTSTHNKEKLSSFIAIVLFRMAFCALLGHEKAMFEYGRLT